MNTKTRKPYAYRSIVFMQGEEAEEPLAILDEKGESAAIEYLSQWDCGEGDIRAGEPWGSSDWTTRKHGYFLSYNLRLGYIGLSAPVSKAQCENWGEDKRIEKERWQAGLMSETEKARYLKS